MCACKLWVPALFGTPWKLCRLPHSLPVLGERPKVLRHGLEAFRASGDLVPRQGTAHLDMRISVIGMSPSFFCDWLATGVRPTTLCDTSCSANLSQHRIKAVDHPGDFVPGDVERWHETQCIRPWRVKQHAVLKCLRDNRRGDRMSQIERQQQSPATDFAKAMARGHPLQLALQIKAGINNGFEKIRIGHPLRNREPSRAHQRIAVERATLIAMFETGSGLRGE